MCCSAPRLFILIIMSKYNYEFFSSELIISIFSQTIPNILYKKYIQENEND
jgi:hypothetical protein